MFFPKKQLSNNHISVCTRNNHRPAHTTKVWDDAVDVMVTTQGELEKDSPDVRGLYFAVLLNEDIALQSDVLSARSQFSAGEQAAGSTMCGKSLDTCTSGEINADARWNPTPFADVEMGPLLGQGAYGKVFLGRMGTDTIVAVKVGWVCDEVGCHGCGENMFSSYNTGDCTACGCKCWCAYSNRTWFK